MSNPTPPAPDPGSKLTGPVADNPAPASTSCARKLFVCLCKLWWIPVVTTILGLVTAAIIIYFTPPVFVATGSLWETAKIRLEGEAAFDENRNNFLGTQSQLLRSDMMREITLNRMKAVGTTGIVNDETGKPIPVDIQVFASSNSSIYTIQARSGNPGFTPAYLNALMEQYLEYRKNIKQAVSTSTLASISEQVQRYERDMKTAQAALTEYEHTNNLAMLQAEATIEVSYLGKLKTELADNQLEATILDRPSLSEAETAQRQALKIKIDAIQKFIKEWEAKVSANNDLIASADGLKKGTYILDYPSLNW